MTEHRITEVDAHDRRIAGDPSSGRLRAVQAVRQPRWAALLVAILATVVYLNALRNGFALDDVWIIPRNPGVTELSNLFRLWAQPYWPGVAGDALGLYRPLTVSLYNLEWAIGGGAAWVFHAANVALHAIASVLVYALARRLAGSTPALAGAIVFAVHPVHTEAVANVVGQAEILAAVFSLIACLLVVPGPHSLGRRTRWALVTVCYAAAAASKEHALVLPALLALVMAASTAPRHGWAGTLRHWLSEWRLFATLAAVAIGFLIVRWWILGSALSVAAPWLPFAGDTSARLLTALRLWPEYARLLLFPFDLSSDYSIAVILPPDGVTIEVVLGMLLLAGLLLIALTLPARPLVGLAAGWFIVAILPTSNLIVVAGVVLAERALYLPSIALSLAIAAGVRAVNVHAMGQRRWLLAFAGVLVVGAFGVRTWLRNPDWRSNYAVNAALLRDHPESYKAQWYAAGVAVARGDTLEAADRFSLALRMEPDNPQLLADYAEFLLLRGQVDSAKATLERAVGSPYYPTKVDNLLALAHLRDGECAAALERIGIAEDRFPPQWQTRLVTMEALYALGRIHEAADVAVDVASLPGRAHPYRRLLAAHVLEEADRLEEATRIRGAATSGADDLAEIDAAAESTLRRLASSSCRVQ